MKIMLKIGRHILMFYAAGVMFFAGFLAARSDSVGGALLGFGAGATIVYVELQAIFRKE